MKAVILGAGRIGCGFAGQVLRDSGYELVFLARDAAMVDHLNALHRYRVSLSDGRRVRELEVSGVRAVGTHDAARVAAELGTADVVVVSVGMGNLQAAASVLAAGLSARTTPVNVLVMENGPLAAQQLRKMVLAEPGAGASLIWHGFAGALVERAVSRRVGEPSGSQPLVFVGDDVTEFRVDSTQMVAPGPGFLGMILTETYDMWVRRKLYTYSAGHAAAAYLGYLKGYHYVHTAIRDREIRAAVLAAMTEGQRGLVARYGRELGDRQSLLHILDRFANAALGDRIERVARDPQRKLGARERLVGAAQLAQRAGVRPLHLALAAAAALFFGEPGDVSAADMEQAIERDGLERTIHRVCGLRPDRGLGRLVRDDCNRLASGRNGGGLLLNLGSDLWSCAPGEAGRPAQAAAANGFARADDIPSAQRRQARVNRGRIYFMLVRRVPPVPSPVLLEVQERLERSGFRVASGIAEEMLQQPDRLAVEHDLYVLKSHTELALSLAGALHHLGARVLHPWPTAAAVQNKIVTSRLLRAAGVPAPDAWVTGDPRLLRETLTERPLILKPYMGHRGQGLHVLHDGRELDDVPVPEAPVIAQEYIEGSGEDLKIYVVGNEVYGVRKRFSPDSFTRPGRACSVDPEVRRIALRCGEALGLGLYGLDLVEKDGQAWVVDVNTFPGYKGVPRVAARIADYIEGYATDRIALPTPLAHAPEAAPGGAHPAAAEPAAHEPRARAAHG